MLYVHTRFVTLRSELLIPTNYHDQLSTTTPVHQYSEPIATATANVPLPQKTPPTIQPPSRVHVVCYMYCSRRQLPVFSGGGPTCGGECCSLGCCPCIWIVINVLRDF